MPKKDARPAHINSQLDIGDLIASAFKMKLGGPKDTLAINALILAGLSTNPTLSQIFPQFIPFISAAAGAAWLSDRMLHDWKSRFVLSSIGQVQSSKPPMAPFEKSGLCFGYSTDKGEAIFIPDEDLFRHVWIVGQSGVGKTVAASLLMLQQIERGGGVLFVDGKLDIDNIISMYQYAAWAGRSHDFYVVNPADPNLSNSYNPILYGLPEQVAARILSIIPSTEGNAGSDYYKQSANEALVVIIGAIQKCGIAYNFYDLSTIMTNSLAMVKLQERIQARAPRSDEARNLNMFLDRFRVPAGDTRNPMHGQIDMKKMKDVLGGIAGRMFSFGSGTCGEVLNTYTPEVNIYNVIRDNKILYIALPTMSMDITAVNFGKILLGDFRTAVGLLQQNKFDRPKIPFLAFLDEAASYVSASWAVMFEQARSAGIFLMPALQNESGLTAISDDFEQRVTGNTVTKMFFRVGTTQTAEMASEAVGMTRRTAKTTSNSGGSSVSNQIIQISPQGNAGQNDSDGISEREEEQQLISPDTFKSLNKGEAILLYEGNKVYDILIPWVSLDKKTISLIGDLRINHTRKRYREGLNFAGISDELMQSSMRQPKKDKATSRADERELI